MRCSRRALTGKHASRCVLITVELGKHSEELDAQIRQAKQDAGTYAQLTNGLSARITTALAD